RPRGLSSDFPPSSGAADNPRASSAVVLAGTGRSATEHPPSEETVLHEREQQDDGEQHYRLRGREAEVVATVEGVEDHDAGCVDRVPGVGRAHHVDVRERLERAYEAADRQVEGHRREHGNGYVAELLGPRGTVYRGGLVHHLGDVAEAGEEDHGVVAGVGPDTEDDYRDERKRWAGPEAAEVGDAD